MKALHLLFILVASLLVGCGTQAPAPTGETATEESEAPEETAESSTISEDASPGEILFKTFYEDAQFACSTCHYPNTDNRLLGPGLLSIEDRFDTYEVDSDDLEAYIKQSIVDPRLFIVPDESPYPENIMPTVYGELFSDDELDELVAYILSF